MRERTIKKNFWLNKEEDRILKEKCTKANITESEYFRRIILNYEIKEKPDQEFYTAMKDLRGIAVNVNQIARKANSLNFIDTPQYANISKELNKFMLEIKEKFLIDRKK